MKKMFFWGFALLVTVAVIPLASGVKGFESKPTAQATQASADENTFNQEKIDKNEINLNDGDIEIIVCKVMEYITEEAHKETKKAILAVCKNNYIYLKSKGHTDFEVDISNYSDSFLKELSTLYKENDYTILLKGDIVPIPLTDQNGGFTATNDEYPYILAVASPWDTFSESYIRGAEYAGGVSIYGISYLCENQMKWNEALSWYLPNFEIET